jgi:hypothetical protein
VSGLRDRLREALSDNGIDGIAADLHSWRCAYQDCRCLDELLDDLIAATSPEPERSGQ